MWQTVKEVYAETACNRSRLSGSLRVDGGVNADMNIDEVEECPSSDEMEEAPQVEARAISHRLFLRQQHQLNECSGFGLVEVGSLGAPSEECERVHFSLLIITIKGS
jgi:hypothetical protein